MVGITVCVIFLKDTSGLFMSILTFTNDEIIQCNSEAAYAYQQAIAGIPGRRR